MNQFYEITGQPAVGKTTLAALTALSFDSVLWLWAPQEVSSGILDIVGLKAQQYQVETVVVAFEFMRRAQGDFDLIVLDSLAGLSPSHPGARRIAPDVERSLFAPKIPILVVNQDRYPVSLGGARWRAMSSSHRLVKLRDKPALFSFLRGDERILKWWEDEKPVFQKPTALDFLWFKEETYESFRKVGRRYALLRVDDRACCCC